MKNVTNCNQPRPLAGMRDAGCGMCGGKHACADVCVEWGLAWGYMWDVCAGNIENISHNGGASLQTETVTGLRRDSGAALAQDQDLGIINQSESNGASSTQGFACK